MERISKNIQIKNHEKIRIKIDSGFACSGTIEMRLYNHAENNDIHLADVDLSEGEKTVSVFITEEIRNFTIGGFGKVSPLPGKSETRVMFTVYDDEEEVDKFDTTEGLFKIMLFLQEKN